MRVKSAVKSSFNLQDFNSPSRNAGLNIEIGALIADRDPEIMENKYPPLEMLSHFTVGLERL